MQRGTDLRLTADPDELRSLAQSAPPGVDVRIFLLTREPYVVREAVALERVLGFASEEPSITSPSSQGPIRSDPTSEDSATFDAEMRFLDHPIEEDIYDEPRRRRWVPALFAGIGIATVGLLVLVLRTAGRSPAPEENSAAPSAGSSAMVSPAAAVPSPVPSAEAPSTTAAAGQPADPVALEPAVPDEPAEQPSGATEASGTLPASPPVPVRAPGLAKGPVPSAVQPAPSYNGLVEGANAALDREQHGRALNLFRQALSLRPTGVEALTGIGWAHLDRGHASISIGWFRRAIAQDRQHEDALLGLAEAYREDGRTPDAVAAYRQYLARYPSGRNAHAAKAQLRDLERGTAIVIDDSRSPPLKSTGPR